MNVDVSPSYLVRVRLEPAVRRLLECERERGEALARAQPHETAVAQLDVGRECVRVTRANAAVDAVGGDDDVGVERARTLRVVGDVRFERELHADVRAAALQDVEQPAPADAAEPVAAGAHGAAPHVHLDVVPVVEGAADRTCGGCVGALEVAERLVREHHAPAERVVRPVALDHAHGVARPRLLQQQRRVEAGGAAADAEGAHVLSERRGAAISLVLK